MKDFILELYSNDNFTLYLTIALVVLVLLFFIVLFFGNKDKKLQKTNALPKVDNSFKEESIAEKVEIESSKEENEIPEKENVVVQDPIIEDEKTEVLPIINEDVNLESNTISEPELNTVTEEPKEVTETIFEPEKETENKETEEFNLKEINFEEISDNLEKELTELENLKNEFNSIEIPNTEVNKKETEELPQEKKEPQVFSSVFVNKNEEDFELPTLKEETKEEKSEQNEAPLEENKSEIKTFSFDDISGETYNLDNK